MKNMPNIEKSGIVCSKQSLGIVDYILSLLIQNHPANRYVSEIRMNLVSAVLYVHVGQWDLKI